MTPLRYTATAAVALTVTAIGIPLALLPGTDNPGTTTVLAAATSQTSPAPATNTAASLPTSAITTPATGSTYTIHAGTDLARAHTRTERLRLAEERALAAAKKARAQARAERLAEQQRIEARREARQAAERREARAQERRQQARLERRLRVAKPRVQAPFTIATFNALGDSHTVKGGNKAHKYTDSTTRTRWTKELFNTYALDVIGLQEFQRIQQQTFLRMAGDTYGHFGSGANSVVWRKSKFEFVNGIFISVPYFGGAPTPMPVVRLRSTETGQEMVFLSVHNPADARGPAQHWRNAAVAKELAYIQNLWDTATPEDPRVPVFLLGDMNDGAEFFCPITATNLMRAAAGGSHTAAGCVMPPFGGVDWITGTKGARFSGFQVIRTPKVERTTDHPLIIARVG